MRNNPTGLVLAFDTTGNLGSVAVLDPAAPERERVETFSPSRRHAAKLLPAIHSALAARGVPLGGRAPGLSLLAATRGPGSFTGLRVGLATLGGLALALDRAAAGVSSLEAAALADLLGSGRRCRRLALVDALRGEVFAAGFGVRPSLPAHPAGRPLGSPRVLRPEAAGRLADELGATRVCGPGAVRYREQVAAGLARAGLTEVELATDPEPLAPAAARLAIGLREADPDGLPSTLAPLYLREPDIHQPPAPWTPSMPSTPSTGSAR